MKNYGGFFSLFADLKKIKKLCAENTRAEFITRADFKNCEIQNWLIDFKQTRIMTKNDWNIKNYSGQQRA